MIDELNSTLQSQSKGRTGKSNFDGNNNYAMWPSQSNSKIDVMSLIPVLLIVGLGIMLLPSIIACFSQIMAPLSYGMTGRRKREAPDSQFPFEQNLMLGLLYMLENAMTKFGRK